MGLRPGVRIMTVDNAHARGWILAGLVIVLSFALPMHIDVTGTPILMLEVFLLLIAAIFVAIGWTRRLDLGRLGLAIGLIILGVATLLYLVHRPGIVGEAGWSFWLKVIGIWIASWMAVDALAEVRAETPGG